VGENDGHGKPHTKIAQPHTGVKSSTFTGRRGEAGPMDPPRRANFLSTQPTGAGSFTVSIV